MDSIELCCKAINDVVEKMTHYKNTKAKPFSWLFRLLLCDLTEQKKTKQYKNDDIYDLCVTYIENIK